MYTSGKDCRYTTIQGIILATTVKGVLILAHFIFLLHSSDHDYRIDDMFQRPATLEHTCTVLAALVRLGTLIELLRTVLKQNTLDYVFSRPVLYRSPIQVHTHINLYIQKRSAFCLPSCV